MKLAIVIPTYWRPDGLTKNYLTRALDSVFAQTHRDFKVFLIGDNYTERQEFENIVSKYKVRGRNLRRAVEREKYTGYQLFCAGGVNATNYGIRLAINEGIDYICHLDHDDYWSEDHLQVVNSITEKGYFMVYTRSTYLNSYLPKYDINGEYQPVPCGLIHSSTCVKFSETKLRFRDCFAETGEAYPADADMWIRITNENRRVFYVNKLTCFHDEEGYSL